MKGMSNKRLAVCSGVSRFRPAAVALSIAAALASGSASADGFQLSEKLSVTGFIDMSYYHVDDGTVSDGEFNFDQFEMDFLYTFDDKLSAQVDLEYQEADEGTKIEQAFFNYAIDDALSVKAGRFLSYSGWETEEPTGLFQYSGAGYAPYFYGYYQDGVSAYYNAGSFGVGLSVVEDLVVDSGVDSTGVELALAITPMEGVTAKAFYMTEDDIDMINTWASYSTGGLTLAAEYNTADNSVFAGSEADGYLLMANYAWDKYGITLRYHDWEVETSSGLSLEEVSGFTIAASIALHDNLSLIAEYRMDEDDVSGADIDSYALEALVTF